MRHFKRAKIFNIAILGVVALFLGSQTVLACTGIILRAADGATVPARTMEFAFDIHSNVLAIPAGTELQTLILDPDNTGFTYTAKYGFLGANGLDKQIVFDGMNTEGQTVMDKLFMCKQIACL